MHHPLYVAAIQEPVLVVLAGYSGAATSACQLPFFGHTMWRAVELCSSLPVWSLPRAVHGLCLRDRLDLPAIGAPRALDEVLRFGEVE